MRHMWNTIDNCHRCATARVFRRGGGFVYVSYQRGEVVSSDKAGKCADTWRGHPNANPATETVPTNTGARSVSEVRKDSRARRASRETLKAYQSETFAGV